MKPKALTKAPANVCKKVRKSVIEYYMGNDGQNLKIIMLLELAERLAKLGYHI